MPGFNSEGHYEIELWRWFHRRFKASYRNYLTWHGFDTLKFDKDVIHSAADRAMLDVCRERFGPVSANFLKNSATSLLAGTSIIIFDPKLPDSAAEIEFLSPFDSALNGRLGSN